MTRQQFLAFCEKMMKSRHQRRRRTMSLAAMAQNQGLSPDFADMTQRDLERTGTRTPERVKVLVDLAVATGKAALSNVVSTDSHQNVTIKLGLRGGKKGAEFDFKAYTPQGHHKEADSIRYTPNAQKLAGISQEAATEALAYAEGVDSSKMLDSMLKAWITIGGFLSVMDSVLFHIRQIANAIADKDYIIYKLPNLSDDLDPTEDTILRGDNVENAIVQAQQEFKTMTLAQQDRSIKKHIRELIAQLQAARSLIRQTSTMAPKSVSGEPLYSEENAESIYNQVKEILESFFNHVGDVINENGETKKDIAAKMSEGDLSEVKKIRQSMEDVSGAWRELTGKLGDKSGGLQKLAKKEDAPERFQSQLPFYIDTKGMTVEQRKKKVAKAFKLGRIMEFLDAKGHLKERGYERIAGRYDIVKNIETGKYEKFVPTATDESSYIKHKRFKQHQKSRNIIKGHLSKVEAQVADTADTEQIQIMKVLKKLNKQQTRSVGRGTYYVMDATNRHGRADLGPRMGDLSPEDAKIAEAIYKARNAYLYGHMKGSDPVARYEKLAPLAKKVYNLLGSEILRVNMKGYSKRNPQAQPYMPKFTGKEQQRRRERNRKEKERLKKLAEKNKT